MHARSSLLALALSGLIASSGFAQGPPPGLGNRPDPLRARPAAPAAKADERANAESPTRARSKSKKKSSTASRAARQRLAQQQRREQAAIAAAAASQGNGMMPAPLGGGDPLGLAPGSPGVVVGGGAPYVAPAFGVSPYANGYYGNPFYALNPFYGGIYFATGGAANGTINLPRTTPANPNGAKTSTSSATAAVGGLVGTSDTQLIHGSDRDGQGDFAPSVGSITSPRVERVVGGTYVPGYGVPVRKGEKVHRGNLIPGYGVIGLSTDQVAGGTYTPGYGVGSFDPRQRNGRTDQVAGGQYVPGYGVMGGVSASGFGGGIPSYYGGSSLPNSYGAVLPSFYGGSALPANYGANASSFYGGSALPQGFGAAAAPSFYNTTGTATTFGGAGASPGFGATIPSAYGASSVHHK